jgi:hypothetical protein
LGMGQKIWFLRGGATKWMRPEGGALYGTVPKNTFLHLSLVIYVFLQPRP